MYLQSAQNILSGAGLFSPGGSIEHYQALASLPLCPCAPLLLPWDTLHTANATRDYYVFFFPNTRIRSTLTVRSNQTALREGFLSGMQTVIHGLSPSNPAFKSCCVCISEHLVCVHECASVLYVRGLGFTSGRRGHQEGLHHIFNPCLCP